MKRILGLDYGEKRIGLSLSDPSKLIATPYKTLENRGINFFLNDIKKIIDHKSIDYIVLGLPLGINGEDTISSLILGMSTESSGPGPLVSFITSRGSGIIKIPITLIPGDMTDSEIDSLT